VHVLAAVYLHNQSRLLADEVDDVPTYWGLATEVVATEPIGAESMPETNFGICHLPPQFPRSLIVGTREGWHLDCVQG
jgi:hypothetical protein